MRTVGLRELKTHLSRYVRRVRGGETVAITDRGEVIAELAPPRRADSPRSALEAMARRGELTLGRPLSAKARKALFSRQRPVLRGMTAQELLDAGRDER